MWRGFDSIARVENWPYYGRGEDKRGIDFPKVRCLSGARVTREDDGAF